MRVDYIPMVVLIKEFTKLPQGSRLINPKQMHIFFSLL